MEHYGHTDERTIRIVLISRFESDVATVCIRLRRSALESSLSQTVEFSASLFMWMGSTRMMVCLPLNSCSSAMPIVKGATVFA